MPHLEKVLVRSSNWPVAMPRQHVGLYLLLQRHVFAVNHPDLQWVSVCVYSYLAPPGSLRALRMYSMSLTDRFERFLRSCCSGRC